MPLDLPSTYGWEPATVCTWAFVIAGDIMVVTTTASCTKFYTDYTVPVLILLRPPLSVPPFIGLMGNPQQFSIPAAMPLPRASCLEQDRPSCREKVSWISKFLLLPVTEQI